ncbi:MAG: hypothetical protein ABI471_04340 [Sphingomonas bacterium]
MVAGLAAPPWRRRLGEVPFLILIAALLGGGGWLLWASQPVNDGHQRWQTAVVAGLAPEHRSDGDSSDLGVDVVLLLPSGEHRAFLVDAAEATRCHVGQRVRLRSFSRKNGADGLSLPPAPCG